MELTPEEFANLVEERIKQKKYDELFSGGCCFHFAMRSHKRGLGQLAHIRSGGDETKIGHVFVIGKDGLGFDHKGRRALPVLKKDFHPRSDIPHFSMKEAEVESHISEKALPEGLEQRVFEIADEIISEKA